MITGMIVRMLSFPIWSVSPIIYDTHVEPLSLYVFAISCLLLIVTLLVGRQLHVKHHSAATFPLSFAIGLLFAYGLHHGGMTNPSKVLDFLAFPSIFLRSPFGLYSRFDPSLMALMMG
jgi:hypothetical protein